MTRNTYTQRQYQKLMADMPRHIAGAFVAAAVGGVVVVASLWATHPSIDLIELGDAAPTPATARVG